ncbi:MAG: glyoxalase [Gammaproteobacteria bacterium]|nr:glyoxalase [Gammaproteobacteria bacterium]|tara:strand:+ start:17 stop:370 length:354 start_codon:yes stop_codon:yes gene_type:complete
MNVHEKINYVEFASRDLGKTKTFFSDAFGWNFEDYGPEYSAFSDEGLDGGFFSADKAAATQNGSALIVFYSETLEETLQKVEQAGGTIIQDIYSFPGGRRFHFTEPAGNEFAVWSDH